MHLSPREAASELLQVKLEPWLDSATEAELKTAAVAVAVLGLS